MLMYLIVQQGKVLEIGRNIRPNGSGISHWAEFIESISSNFAHPLAILLAQIVTIVFVARIFGWIFKKMGQPTVIGEIVAGIILGPSLIGLYFPGFTQIIFPVDSLGNIQFLSQFGLILFMFIVGIELDLKTLKDKASDAIVISHASIIVPFTFGLGLAYLIYPSFAPKNIPFLSFGLFIGIAMSITAFPVLARIVHEKEIHKTRLGTIVITCAAIDDITAWCILAAVIAIVKAGSFLSSLYTILIAIGYFFVMVKVVKPFLKRVAELYPTREYLSKQVVAIFLFTLILSAYATEVIGIHALFGAFIAGTIMPGNLKFKNIFVEKIEDVTLVLLLPLFFVYTGLRTQIGLINDPELWEVTGLIILVAVAGKFLGGSLSAKFVGQGWHDSLSIGALMNTRGLMELVVLNIGYDLGVLSPEIFSMMVIMALVTTIMTGPALYLIRKLFKNKEGFVVPELNNFNKFRILISFGNPERGKILLRVANSFMRKSDSSSAVTVMHLSPNNELNQVNIDEYETESFLPLVNESKVLDLKINPLFKVTNDIYSEITDVANKGHYNLLLVGLGQSIFEGSFLGRILGFTTSIIVPDKLINTVTGKNKLFERSLFEESTRFILAKVDVPVGIFIDKNLLKVEKVFIPVASTNDSFLVRYIKMLVENPHISITIIDVSGTFNISEIGGLVNTPEDDLSAKISFILEEDISGEKINENDLMLVSLESWKKIVKARYSWLAQTPSTLIIRE